MKKVIPLEYLHHDDQEIELEMQNKICGIMCVAMILKTYEKDFGTLQELVDQSKDFNAYIPGVGWDHRGLVRVLEAYDVKAERREFKTQTEPGIWKRNQNFEKELKEILDQNQVIIISVDTGFSTNLISTHLIILHGYETDDFRNTTSWLISDPSSEVHQQKEVSAEYFERYFRGLGIVVSVE